MVDTPLTIRSPSTCRTFWNTPCVAGCVGPRLRVNNSSCGSLSLKTGLLPDILETESLIISLSSEEIVFLIYLIGVFQRIFFPHGKHLHIVYIQNTPQIRVPDELYTEEIVGLTLHPIRTIPQHGSGGNGWIPPLQEHFDADTHIIDQTVHMVYHCKLLFQVGVVYGRDVRQIIELQFFIGFQKLQDLQQLRRTGFERSEDRRVGK